MTRNNFSLTDALSRIEKVDDTVFRQALERHNTLTKPLGSLGRLELLSARIAAIQNTVKPTITRKAVAIFAADHGVAAAGVSAYPQSVTAGMVKNFLAGGAAINALAQVARAELLVIDVGVDADFEPHPKLWSRKIAHGTQSLLNGPAMTRAEAEAACSIGIEVANMLVAQGVTLLAGGEMGIGNSTAAAALTTFFTERTAQEVTGRGTGVDDEGLVRKVRVVERALARHQGDIADPLDALARLGGLEIAALTGFYIGAAAAKTTVVLDGFIATAAALVAAALKPAIKDYLVASHLSQEIGHKVQLKHLSLEPLFDFGLRLGEGTGAVLAIGPIESAAAALSGMSTFADAVL